MILTTNRTPITAIIGAFRSIADFRTIGSRMAGRGRIESTRAIDYSTTESSAKI